MPSISRQYHPQSCSLEITAQTSPLSRWAKRPILKSVHFLLSFRGLTGPNHEPLEIRGNQEQLHLLADTVTQYVQNRLGQSLGTSIPHDASNLSTPEQASETSTSSAQLYLRPRSLVTHDLILGSLATNADQQTVSLKSSQLFDLVSALEDCTAELDVLPISSPRPRPTLPVWASSAAVIILMLGVSTATFQLTRKQPTLQQDWVTSSDQPDTNSPATSADDAEGIAAVPKGQTKPQPQPSTPSNLPSPPPSPSGDSTELDSAATPPQSPPAVIASAPRPQPLAPSRPTESATSPAASKAPERPPASAKRQPFSDRQPSGSNAQKPVIDQPAHQKSQAPVAASPADESLLRSQAQPASPPLTAAPPPAAAPEPVTSAETSAEQNLQGVDRLSDNPQTPKLSRRNQPHQFGRTAPGIAESAFVAPSSDPSQNIQQYLKQRWQVPANLDQPLRYQLSLNPDGTLKQVKPLDSIATQYLDQVPLPALNQPFIAPLQSSQPLQVQLILQPDGTIQIVEGLAGKKPSSP